jgi:hypothetical protein
MHYHHDNVVYRHSHGSIQMPQIALLLPVHYDIHCSQNVVVEVESLY